MTNRSKPFFTSAVMWAFVLFALLGSPLIAEVLPADQNPNYNPVLNPKHNPILNPKHNPILNPKFNPILIRVKLSIP